MSDPMDEYTETLRRGRKRGEIEATVKVTLTDESEDAPNMGDCRYAVLPLGKQTDGGTPSPAYAIYDRILNRIVDGVYCMPLDEVLGVAARLSEQHTPYPWRSPNGEALGLIYPDMRVK